MSNLDSLNREVQRHHDAIAKLQQQKADRSMKSADLSKRAIDAGIAASRATSMSTALSKQRDAQRYEQDRGRVEGEIAGIERKIADEQRRLAEARQRLVREEAAQTKRAVEQTRRDSEATARAGRAINQTLARHAVLHDDVQSRLQALETLPQEIRVVFFAANPLDQESLRLDEEVRAIERNIRMSKHRDSVHLKSCWAIRPTDVLLALNEHRPTVVHFSGHGTEHGEILFQDDAGNAKPVALDAIVQLFKACSGGLRLVFFNTCFSDQQALAVTQHVEAAVGMTTSVSDDAARTSAAAFYMAVGFGRSLYDAHEQAKALLQMESIPEHDIPALFVQEGLDSRDIFLVRPASATEHPAIPDASGPLLARSAGRVHLPIEAR